MYLWMCSTWNSNIVIKGLPTSSFNRISKAGAIVFETSKAFDSVWLKGLIFTFSNYVITRMAFFSINSFPTGRLPEVCIKYPALRFTED